MSEPIDLTGRRYGAITVTGRNGTRVTKGGYKKPTWDYLCDCGTSGVADGQNLRRGDIQSCGCRCNRTEALEAEMAGRRFGRLTVLERAGTQNDEPLWRCRCDCGSETVVRGRLLREGITFSCGCLNALLAATRRWTGTDASYEAVHDRLRARFGPASAHLCVDCGQSAREWSYHGGDPDERREKVACGYVLAFTTSIDAYSPRCVRCHRRYDAAIRKGVATS